LPRPKRARLMESWRCSDDRTDNPVNQPPVGQNRVHDHALACGAP
jgi:hypothetical protein